MKRGTVALLAALSLAVMVTGGCANKEVVKSEEPVVKTDTTQKGQQPAQPEPPKQVETKRVAPPTVTEAPKQAEGQGSKASVAEANLETVYFDYDKSDLSKGARDSLSRNADYLLKTNPAAKVRIEGHCDERGSAEYNLALGERRAKSSMQYLLTLGVPADRLSTVSFGKEKPAVDGHDEAAWAKNRRAELVVVK